MHIFIPPPPGENTAISDRKALSALNGSHSVSFSGALAAQLPSLEAVYCEPNSQMAGDLCSSGRAKSALLDGLLCSALPSQLFFISQLYFKSNWVLLSYCWNTKEWKRHIKARANSCSGLRLESPFSLSFFNCLLTAAPTRQHFKSKNTRPAQKSD